MPRRDALAVQAPAAIEVQRRDLARYDARMRVLGFASTFAWCGGSVYTGFWLHAELCYAGLTSETAFLLTVPTVVITWRLVVLRVHRLIRDRLRRRRAALLDRARTDVQALAHLSPGLASIVTELQALRTAILAPHEHPEGVIERLRGWVACIARLDDDDREHMSERGIDLSPLRPLLRLAPLSAEPRGVWADRAYRRLQVAVPILDHFEQQLTRLRDDAYR